MPPDPTMLLPPPVCHRFPSPAPCWCRRPILRRRRCCHASLSPPPVPATPGRAFVCVQIPLSLAKIREMRSRRRSMLGPRGVALGVLIAWVIGCSGDGARTDGAPIGSGSGGIGSGADAAISGGGGSGRAGTGSDSGASGSGGTTNAMTGQAARDARCGPVLHEPRCLRDGSCWDGPRVMGGDLYAIDGPADASSLWAVGGNGSAFRYCEGTWLPMETGVSVALYGVVHPSADFAVAVGEKGTVIVWNGHGPSSRLDRAHAARGLGRNARRGLDHRRLRVRRPDDGRLINSCASTAQRSHGQRRRKPPPS